MNGNASSSFPIDADTFLQALNHLATMVTTNNPTNFQAQQQFNPMGNSKQSQRWSGNKNNSNGHFQSPYNNGRNRGEQQQYNSGRNGGGWRQSHFNNGGMQIQSQYNNGSGQNQPHFNNGRNAGPPNQANFNDRGNGGVQNFNNPPNNGTTTVPPNKGPQHHISYRRPLKKPHSADFREYCDNTSTPELDNLVFTLLKEVNSNQRVVYARDPQEARTNPQICQGFRKVTAMANAGKLKLAIIATDCERQNPARMAENKVDMDDSIRKLKETCREKNIPICYALRRRRLSFALFSKIHVRCVGILTPDVAQDTYTELLRVLSEEKQKYKKIVARLQGKKI